MTRTIAIISGKGGVGKTTLTSNLATALAQLGEDVVAVDANLTTPNLGIHLGMHFAPNTIHHVLKGEVKVKDSTYPHALGFKVIPASMSVEDLSGVDPTKLHDVTLNLLGKADFVLIDSAAGLGREAVSAMNAVDEILLITNPDLPSVADVLKTVKLAESLNKKVVGIVVNRIRRKGYELTKAEVEEMTGYPVITEIPDDRSVPKSLFAKTPVVDYSYDSPAAFEFRRLAHILTGRRFIEKRKLSFRILERLSGWATR